MKGTQVYPGKFARAVLKMHKKHKARCLWQLHFPLSAKEAHAHMLRAHFAAVKKRLVPERARARALSEATVSRLRFLAGGRGSSNGAGSMRLGLLCLMRLGAIDMLRFSDHVQPSGA